MSPRRGGEGQPPRIPTWLLVLAVIVTLGGAGWLFSGDLRGDDGDEPAATTQEADDDLSVLDLPKDQDEDDEDEADDDPRRRGEAGRDRLDDEAARSSDDEAAASEDDGADDEPELPPTAVNLADRRIALVPASAGPVAGSPANVRVAGARVPCAGTRDTKDLALELDLLDRVERLLDRAGAVPVRLDDDDHAVTCADARVRAQAGASAFLVVDAGTGEPARVLAARPAAPAASAAGARLAGELATALGLRAPAAATAAGVRAELARAGAVEATRGAHGALVRVGLSEDAGDERLDELALDIVTALANDATAATSSSGQSASASRGTTG